MKQLIPLLAAIILISCASPAANNNAPAKDSTAAVKKDSTATTKAAADTGKIKQVKDWLINSIENEFSAAKRAGTATAKSIYTKQYEAYKTDAANVDMDNGITAAQFKKKWASKYNTELGGLGNGFLIDAQDWGKIKVTHCAFKSDTTDGGWLFDTLIEDVQFKTAFKRDIKVVPDGDSFLIADVLEYNK